MNVRLSCRFFFRIHLLYSRMLWLKNVMRAFECPSQLCIKLVWPSKWCLGCLALYVTYVAHGICTGPSACESHRVTYYVLCVCQFEYLWQTRSMSQVLTWHDWFFSLSWRHSRKSGSVEKKKTQKKMLVALICTMTLYYSLSLTCVHVLVRKIQWGFWHKNCRPIW